jgi:hypothetical protein
LPDYTIIAVSLFLPFSSSRLVVFLFSFWDCREMSKASRLRSDLWL